MRHESVQNISMKPRSILLLQKHIRGMKSRVFSNISSSVILSLHSFKLELILNIVELYSLNDLKSCNRKCIQS